MAFANGFFSNPIIPFHQLGFLLLSTQISLFANLDFSFFQHRFPSSPLGSVVSCTVSTLEYIMSFTKTVGHYYQGFSLVLSAWL